MTDHRNCEAIEANLAGVAKSLTAERDTLRARVAVLEKECDTLRQDLLNAHDTFSKTLTQAAEQVKRYKAALMQIVEDGDNGVYSAESVARTALTENGAKDE